MRKFEVDAIMDLGYRVLRGGFLEILKTSIVAILFHISSNLTSLELLETCQISRVFTKRSITLHNNNNILLIFTIALTLDIAYLQTVKTKRG